MNHGVATLRTSLMLGAGLCFLLSAEVPALCASSGVQLIQKEDRVRVELNGQLFTEYYFTNVPRPYLYPLLGPGNLPMTRDWPMKPDTTEEHDHPHHRSFWFAHGSVNGTDLWSEGKDSGKTIHNGFLEVSSGTKTGVIQTRNTWVTKEGTALCTDERTITFHVPGPNDERIVDFQITLKPQQGDLTLGDTKEGTMAIRLAETMRLKGKVGKGHIINSEGQKDDATWGKRAKWCDYYGPVGDQTIGVAIFDTPSNPRYPTWWHVRDYGLFAANPFGQHDFESLKDKTAGNLVIPAGKSATFRYRFILHKGDEKAGKISEAYDSYVKGKK
jgi:hypothetical protein